MDLKKKDTEKAANSSISQRKYGTKVNIFMILLLCVACALLFWGKDGVLTDKEKSSDIPPPPPRKAAPAPEIVIQRILLQPSEATKRDTLHAEIFLSEAAKASKKHFQYFYAWKVNNQPISHVSGDSLELSEFNVGDRITVTVTPYDGTAAALVKTSQIVTIRAILPSLDLRTKQASVAVGELFECRLVSEHPDGETVTFSLEEPKLKGMILNTKTGWIRWRVPSIQKETLQFGASVVDSLGNKTTKMFAIEITPDSASPAADTESQQ